MRRNRFDNRQTVELPAAERCIPTGMRERRQSERSPFNNLKKWLLEVVEGEGTDTDKVDSVRMILRSIEKDTLNTGE